MPKRKMQRDSYDEALEKADIIRQIIAIRDNIEEVSDQIFEATHWPIARVRNANQHLIDCRKSLSAAVAAFPDAPVTWRTGWPGTGVLSPDDFDHLDNDGVAR